MSWQFIFPLLTMGLKPRFFTVLAMLADEAQNGVVAMSYERLAAKCGITRRSAIDVVRELEATGKVTIECAGGIIDGRKVPNSFRLRWLPKTKKQEPELKGAKHSPIRPGRVNGTAVTGEKLRQGRVNGLHPDPLRTPLVPRRERAREARPSPASPRIVASLSKPPAAVAFDSGCGLDVPNWQHKEFIERMANSRVSEADADGILRAGYRDAISEVRRSAGVPAGRSADFWFAWFDAAHATLRANRGRRPSTLTELAADNVQVARGVAGGTQ